MKLLHLLFASIALIALSACSDNTTDAPPAVPSPSQGSEVLGHLTVHISGIGSEITTSSAEFVPILSNQQLSNAAETYTGSDFTELLTETFVEGGVRYINTLYTFVNKGGEQAFTLVAIDDDVTLDTTPFKNVRAYDGSAITTNTAGLSLGQGQSYNYAASALVTHPANGFVTGIDTTGLTADAGENIIPQGFEAWNSTLTSKTIPANEDAKVLFSTFFNTAGNTDPFAFSMSFLVATEAAPTQPAGSLPWINELHYDNDGADTNEFIEVFIPQGFDTTGLSLELYNGNGGGVYLTQQLDGVTGPILVQAQVSGIQNGNPDGLALCQNNQVIGAGTTEAQFLSYGGNFAATDGCANGLSSTDIGVNETGTTPADQSLQLSGTGNKYSDFTWQAPATATPQALNNGQTLQ